MTEPLVRTSGLTKHYGGNRAALADLNLTIAPGEVFGLLGPNGSGKSTALRLLLGLIQPTTGSASIAGFDCWRDSVEVRKRTVYLPGELRLYDSMTGRQLLRFLDQLRGSATTADPEPLARRLDIDLDQSLTKMSSGMKRKVALISVLLPNVELIILDEPTNTLDPVMRDELLEQLRQAKKRGQTILFSSHVLSEVEQVCDRVGILQRGQLVHVQDMRDMRRRRVHIEFAEAPGSLPGMLWLTERQPVDKPGRDYEFEGEMNALLDWLGRQQVRDLRIEPTGLTPIYQRFHGVAAES